MFSCYLSASLLFYYFLKYYAFQWHNLSKLEQAKYYEMAKTERQAHQSKELCSQNTLIFMYAHLWKFNIDVSFAIQY